ncbi:MAG: hypothetical protein WBD31_17960 [Rubripirellula sp.]
MAQIDAGVSLGATPDKPDSNLDEILQQAKKTLSTGDVAATLDHLKPLASHPDVSDVDVVMADLFFALGRQKEGMQWLERASAKDPKRMAIYLSFCEIAVRQQRWFDGWNLSRLGERMATPDHWSANLTERLKRRFTFLQGVCNEGRSDWTGARRDYETLRDEISSDSESSRRNILLGLARCCVRLEDGEAAFAAITTLCELDLKLSPPRQLLAQIYEQSGMVEKADQAYRENVGEASDAQKELARLAYVRFLIYNNEPDKAEPLLRGEVGEAEESEKHDDRVLLQAILARMQGRMDDARSLFSKIHRERPESIVVANHLAAILVEDHDEAMRARALQIAESTVRNAPSSADSWATLGWVRLRLGDTVAAEASLVQSLKLGKPTRDTLYYLAKLNRATGKQKEAEMFERLFATSSGPNLFGNDE